MIITIKINCEWVGKELMLFAGVADKNLGWLQVHSLEYQVQHWVLHTNNRWKDNIFPPEDTGTEGVANLVAIP